MGSKWIIDLKTMRLLEAKSIIVNLSDLALSNGFLAITTKAQVTQEKDTGLQNIKLLSFMDHFK